jgi:hypothetical protein
VYSRNLPGIALLIAVFAPHTGSAGPPFRTDDPVPVEPQHWKICLFSTGTHAAGGTAGILPGIDDRLIPPRTALRGIGRKSGSH